MPRGQRHPQASDLRRCVRRGWRRPPGCPRLREPETGSRRPQEGSWKQPSLDHPRDHRGARRRRTARHVSLEEATARDPSRGGARPAPGGPGARPRAAGARGRGRGGQAQADKARAEAEEQQARRPALEAEAERRGERRRAARERARRAPAPADERDPDVTSTRRATGSTKTATVSTR